MNLELSEEQGLIRDTARGFAERVLAPRAAARDASSAFPVEELAELAKLGLLGVNVPAALGGSEAGVVAYALAIMELARADASVAVAVAVSNMVAELIAKVGTPEQAQAWVPALVAGKRVVGAFALSEPQAGSDPSAIASVARPTDRGFALTGTKQWITSGTHAGLFLVWARSDEVPGSRGLSVFMVPSGTPGLTVGRSEDKMGLRGSSTVQLHLEDCEVPASSMLGGRGGGFKLAMLALDGGRIGIASQATGVATAALEAAIAYAKQRIQFGVPLAKHQAIQMMLADMAVDVASSRLLALRAAWLKETGAVYQRAAAIAKLHASERAWKVCDRAVSYTHLTLPTSDLV